MKHGSYMLHCGYQPMKGIFNTHQISITELQNIVIHGDHKFFIMLMWSSKKRAFRQNFLCTAYYFKTNGSFLYKYCSWYIPYEYCS